MKYKTYLKSEHWKELRALKVEEKPRCERCNEYLDIEVHHTTYRDGWHNVRLHDLETLCHNCHNRHHVVEGSPLTHLKLVKLEAQEREKPVKKFKERKGRRRGYPRIQESIQAYEQFWAEYKAKKAA